MAESLEIQNALLSMKCCLCNQVLSVPPIISISEDGKQLKCGRCKNVEKPFCARNFALENISQFLSFPCIYENCDQMIPWKEVVDHEDFLCANKTIKCPIYYECDDDIVEMRTFEEHMNDKHPGHFFLKTLEDTLPSNDACIYVVKDCIRYFFVSVTHSSTTLDIYFAGLNKINILFAYELKLSSIHDDAYSVTIENQPINNYDERDHCFKCIDEKCDLIHHPHSRVNGNVPVNVTCNKIDLTHIKPLFGDDSEIKFSMKIVPNDFERCINKLVDGNRIGKTVRKIDPTVVEQCVDLLREQLKCSVCMDYMTLNIYNCQKGHVVCNMCRTEHSECTSCQTRIRKSRNLPLQKLADEIVLTCLFSKNGCEFTGKLVLLSEHEENCKHNIM
ncbi:unnamed protein product [Phaedon cochleariae]|uniref:E3 ubiquitin-protein ligase Sina-like RING finger domain-containing protein n=1 Tax=Phaedon cochleariae TaxID=80249 RepID=A0A9N9X553_PHACE|nr:unnamed protein product [Phaedon cochleariae]